MNKITKNSYFNLNYIDTDISYHIYLNVRANGKQAFLKKLKKLKKLKRGDK